MTLHEPLRRGDLVRVEMMREVYHGLVINDHPDTYVGNTVEVFLGNGLKITCPVEEVEPVPLHFLSPCTTNFAECLKEAQVPPGDDR